MVSLGMILILAAVFVFAVVIWDYEKEWDEMYDAWDWSLEDDD